MNEAKPIYYYSYGSNILTKRLEDRVGKVTKICNYVLEGYGVAFNAGIWRGFANIIPRNEESVEGVVYELTDRQIAILDNYEGWPINYQKQYFQMEDGKIIFAYVSNNTKYRTTKKPDLNYINKILDGAKEHGLTRTYNLLVKYKNNNYPLKKGNRHKFIET